MVLTASTESSKEIDYTRIMKKIIILFIVIFSFILPLIVIANNVKSNKWQVSELTTDGGTFPTIRGTLKNVSNDDCEKVKIIFIAKNGNLKVKGEIWVDNPEKGEIKEFNEMITGEALDIKKLEDYEIKLSKVECLWKKDTN